MNHWTRHSPSPIITGCHHGWAHGSLIFFGNGFSTMKLYVPPLTTFFPKNSQNKKNPNLFGSLTPVNRRTVVASSRFPSNPKNPVCFDQAYSSSDRGGGDSRRAVLEASFPAHSSRSSGPTQSRQAGVRSPGSNVPTSLECCHLPLDFFRTLRTEGPMFGANRPFRLSIRYQWDAHEAGSWPSENTCPTHLSNTFLVPKK